MVRRYLQSLTDPAAWRDLADYPNGIPYPAPMGWGWVEGEPANPGTITVVKKPFDQMQERYAGLPVEVQVAFGPVMAQAVVFAQFNGWPALVSLISQTPVPEELQDVKSQFLAIAEAAL